MQMNIKLHHVLIILILGAANTGVAEEVKPFTSDGCSAFPDGTLEQQDLWLSCCIKHDKSYWSGGSYQERIDADRELKHCVAKVGEPAIAELMKAGVRVGGSPFFPTKFRWGYGWPYMVSNWPFLRGYKELTAEEQKNVDTLLKHATNNSEKQSKQGTLPKK
jgi:hypothetical protein